MIDEAIDFQQVLNRIPEGWCGEDKARHLYELAIQSGCERSVELGVFGGRSLIPIAMAHRDAGNGFVLGIDAWTKSASLEGTNDQANNQWWDKLNYHAIYKSCTEAIDFFGLNEYCGTVRMRSLTFGVLIEDDSLTMLHQDSNHSQEITCAEVNLFAPKIKSGGIWISDDSRWPTVQRSIEMLNDYGFEMIGEYPNGENFYKVFKKQ